MEVVRTLSEMKEWSNRSKQEGKTIGFVPTMGYLHEGHQRLMWQARKETEVLVASIFVNPLQFGPNEDFDKYPRNEQRDIAIAEQEGVDFLFMPDVEEMYPDEQTIQVKVTGRTDVLCGRSRPGHFDGVATVLTKLFHVVNPDQAYFGWKDAQQVAVVDGLVKDLNFPIDIIPVETVREADGLAKSSRNVYLSERERQEAAFLFQALEKGRNLVIDGEKNPVNIVKEIKHFINAYTHGKIDYVELLSYPELKSVDQIQGQVILALAVQFQTARLIDNRVFDSNGVISERIR